MPSAVVVEDVAKRYPKVTALDGVSFDIPEGEAFGLLGPNGAGKTTLIRVLSTLERADAGRAEVAGFDVRRRPAKVRARIGIVFQEPSLDTVLTGRENLWLHARLYGLARRDAAARIEEGLALVHLGEAADRRVKTYSGGMKRRLELARGLLHAPAILFLDEPTLGLDPQSRERLWTYIAALKREGTTVLLTTHYMEEADALCDRVAIISQGRIVALDSPRRLKDAIGQTVVRLRQPTPTPDAFRRLPFVKEVEQADGELRLTLSGGVAHLHEIVQAAGRLDRLEVGTPTLQDVFLHHTGRELRDEGAESWTDAAARMAHTRSGKR